MASSLGSKLPQRALTLLIDPANPKCVTSSSSEVKNLAGNNNKEFDPTLSDQHWDINNGPSDIMQINHSSSDGYLDFGRVSPLNTAINDYKPYTHSVYNLFNDTYKSGLESPGATVQGRAFRYDSFKELPSTYSGGSGNTLALTNHFAYRLLRDDEENLTDISQYKDIDPQGDGLDTGHIPRDSTCMAWVWVSSTMNGTSRTAYIYGGQYRPTRDIKRPELDPESHIQTGYDPDSTTQQYRPSLCVKDVGQGKFFFCGELYAGTSGKDAGFYSSTPYANFSAGYAPYNYFETPKYFDYDQWYCVMFVRQAASGYRTHTHSGYVQADGSGTGFARNISTRADGTTWRSSSDYVGSHIKHWPAPFNNFKDATNTRGDDRPGALWKSTTYVDLEKIYDYNQIARGAEFKWIGMPASSIPTQNSISTSGDTSAFRGKIGAIAVWDRILTGDELKRAYNCFKGNYTN